MTSIVTDVLKVTLELLFTKVRDHVANKLKEGDLNNEQCRQLIVGELEDIKSKIDGLARKDLISSVSFLNEGIRELNFYLYPAEEETADSGEAEGSRMKEHGARSVINEALPLWSTISQATSRLSIVSEDSIVSAKALFKTAREEATRAFSNEALSTEDRILAIKLRVISRILEGLDNPNAAANACIGYLEELHDMPAVRDIFSVYLNGGIKAHFNKTKRFEHVTSVTMINFVVFDFTQKFAGKISLDLINWPRIELEEGENCHPIVLHSEILKNAKQPDGEQACSNQMNTFDQFFNECCCFRVNSKREIVGCTWESGIKVMVYNTSTGGCRSLCALDAREVLAEDKYIYDDMEIAVDGDDNVYIIAKFEANNGVYHFKLFVIDANGSIKCQSSLEFLKGKHIRLIRGLGLSMDGAIIMNIREPMHEKEYIWIFDQSGQLKHKFGMENCTSRGMCVSDRNNIIVASCIEHTGSYAIRGNYNDERPRRCLYIYQKDGKLCRTIKIAAHPGDVAFNYISKKIIILGNACLSSYSETGEQQGILEFPYWMRNYRITSHPSGPVALVYEEGVIFVR